MRFRTENLAVVTLVACLAGPLQAASHEGHQPELPRTTAPDGAAVYIVSPADGATLSSPVTIVFGLRGMGVGPAGLDNPMTGHHHLIVDAPLPDLNLPIPSDDHYIHFGGGQTEVTRELAAGKHTLQILLGDLNHIPHTNPLLSKRIAITVKDE